MLKASNSILALFFLSSVSVSSLQPQVNSSAGWWCIENNNTKPLQVIFTN